MKKNLSILAASLLLLGLGACQEEKEYSPLTDGAVKVTVYATRGEAETRSILYEENGNLNCAWQTGDQLIVTNAEGGKLGVLALTDEATGKFEGELVGLSEGKMNLNYFFLGTGVDGEKVSQNHTFDLSSQDGKLESLGKYDALSASAEITVIKGKTYVNENLQLGRHFAFAHFTLTFPEDVTTTGVTFTMMTDVTVTITGLDTKATLGFTDRALSEVTAGTVTVNGTVGDIYVNIIPGKDVSPTFKATVNGKEYEGSLRPRDIAAGVYLRKADRQGVPVQMAEVKTEDPSNPGNTDHWGGEDEDPTYENSGKGYARVSEADGWTVNFDMYNNGGFCTPITYSSNGIFNNLLTSNAGRAFFFQWGRWLGFPTICARTHFNDKGSFNKVYPVESQYLNGVNAFDQRLGYTWDSGLKVSYGTCWMGNTDWTPGRANNCSIMFGKVYRLGTEPLDYVGANEDCKWEDRSGNPCPDGYRIPTAAELQALIPASGSVEGSCAEIKEIDGIRYAMQWKVLKNSSNRPYVEIKSVKTSASSVAVDDPAFKDVKALRLFAWRYMDNKAESNEDYEGLYWSNESGTNTFNGTNGLGGKALYINFTESTAEMSIIVVPRSYAANIIPIKDPIAKATPLTPWFPLSGQ